MTDIVERLRATSDWYGPANVGVGGPMLEAADEIERLRATVEWQRRALQINSEEIEQPRAELARVTRERDAALDALAKSVERINDLVTEIKLWENDVD